LASPPTTILKSLSPEIRLGPLLASRQQQLIAAIGFLLAVLGVPANNKQEGLFPEIRQQQF